MKITDLINKNAIDLNVHISTKKELIKKATELMAQNGNIKDLEKYENLVLKREKEGSTGIGEGIAIPHGKGECITKPGLAAMVIPNGADFDALDGNKVNLLFLIAAPDTKDNIHICYYKYNNLNYSCWLDYLTLHNTNCIDCKINFLGTWTTNTTETDKNLYVTESLPCITYINKNKELCFINSANIKLIAENHAENVLDYVSIVDTNVSNFSCCLGYRTTAKPENDQGLVISYIKDNKVYYVSYYYDLESNKLTLSSSYKLGNYTNATGVSVTRTNDYRLAFLIHTTDNENYVHITERSYIGSAVKDEIGNLNNIKYLNYITLQNVNYTINDLLTRNTYLDTEDNHKVIIEYLTELYNPYNELNYEYLKNYITVKTTANRVLELTNIEIICRLYA